MSKQFVKGNKYVFVAKKCKKYIKSHGYYEWSDHKFWVNKINGLEVIPKFSQVAECGGYFVSPNWCKCIGR